jgi:hypothetical protein
MHEMLSSLILMSSLAVICFGFNHEKIMSSNCNTCLVALHFLSSNLPKLLSNLKGTIKLEAQVGKSLQQGYEDQNL